MIVITDLQGGGWNDWTFKNNKVPFFTYILIIYHLIPREEKMHKNDAGIKPRPNV